MRVWFVPVFLASLCSAAPQHTVNTAQLSTVSPLWVPVTGGTVFQLHGSGISKPSTGGDAQCVVTGNNPIYGLATYTVPATVVNATAVSCTAPAVPVEGTAAVSLTLDGGKSFSNTVALQFVQLLDADVSQFPFTDDEAQGHVVFVASSYLRPASGSKQVVTVRGPTGAALGSAPWAPDGVVRGAAFPLAGAFAGPFADARNVSLTLVLAGADGHPHGLNRTVEAVRLPRKANQVVVDRWSRGLLVLGAPWQGNGWLANAAQGYDVMLQQLVSMAQHGFNQIMPYGWNTFTLHEQMAFLDACASVGVMVQVPVLEQIGLIRQHNDTTQWAVIQALVDTVKDHPALLGYYISDDTVGGPIALYEQGYAFLKTLDPHHPVFNTIVGSGQAWQYTTPRKAFDVAQYEIYQASDLPQVLDTGFVPLNFPMRFTPQFICSQGYRTKDAGTREVRLEAYLSFIHNGTGLIYWDFWDWTTTTALSMYMTASLVAFELAELVPSTSSTLPPPNVSVSSSGDVRLAAWREPASNCLTVTVANGRRAPVADVAIDVSGETGAAAVNASALFEDRVLSVADGVIREPLGSFSTRVYQLQCAPAAAAAPASGNLVANAGFEESPLAGKPMGWYPKFSAVSNGVLNTPAPWLMSDTTAAASGRHSLRVTTSLQSAASPFNVPLPALGNIGSTSRLLSAAANTAYNFSVATRSNPALSTWLKATPPFLRLYVMPNGSHPQDVDVLATLAVPVDAPGVAPAWHTLAANVRPPRSGTVFLEASSALPMWLDDVFFGAATAGA